MDIQPGHSSARAAGVCFSQIGAFLDIMYGSEMHSIPFGLANTSDSFIRIAEKADV